MSRSHVRVRPAELADVPQLVAVISCTDLPSGSAGARQFHAGSLARLPERLAQMIEAPDRTVLVAVEEGTADVAGAIVLDEDEVAAVAPTPVLSVRHLVVAPQHRRRGVARALLAAAVHLADQRGIEHVVASATAGSREANRYFARLGFAPLVVRRVASTAVLRRSLGLPDGPDRLALLRRVRGRALRPRASVRPMRRGA